MEPVSCLIREGLLSEHNPFTSLPSHTSPPNLMSQGPLAFHNKSLSNLSVCETFPWQREAAYVCVCKLPPTITPSLCPSEHFDVSGVTDICANGPFFFFFVRVSTWAFLSNTHGLLQISVFHLPAEYFCLGFCWKYVIILNNNLEAMFFYFLLEMHHTSRVSTFSELN